MVIQPPVGGAGGASPVPNDPNEPLGFEISGEGWSFAPVYYPDRFTQTKDRDENRDGKQCKGENISIKQIKNREFHITGVVLGSQVRTYNELMDDDGNVDIISPLIPGSGMECKILSAELGEQAGFDPLEREWRFEYTVDLVSTGRDEYGGLSNGIVDQMTGDNPADVFG